MRSVFINFLLWVKDLVIFELRFGFLMNKSIYGQMETPGDPHLNRKIKKNHKKEVWDIFLMRLVFLYFWFLFLRISMGAPAHKHEEP